MRLLVSAEISDPARSYLGWDLNGQSSKHSSFDFQAPHGNVNGKLLLPRTAPLTTHVTSVQQFEEGELCKGKLYPGKYITKQPYESILCIFCAFCHKFVCLTSLSGEDTWREWDWWRRAEARGLNCVYLKECILGSCPCDQFWR